MEFTYEADTRTSSAIVCRRWLDAASKYPTSKQNQIPQAR